MDDIEDDEQDRFWDNSEEDSFEESEGDVEIHIAECNDIQDDSARYWDKSQDQSGEESGGDVKKL